MELVDFVRTLLADGRVLVADIDVGTDNVGDDVVEQLVAFEAEYRQDLFGTPPPLSRRSAVCGMVALYQACRFLIYPQHDQQRVRQAFKIRWEKRCNASVHYSVDLTLRFLPDVVQRARRQAERSVLIDELLRLGGRWPLSSVGIEGVVPADVETLVAHPCLLQLYVDRIIARRDLARLNHPAVREAAERAWGMFPELASSAIRTPTVVPLSANKEKVR